MTLEECFKGLCMTDIVKKQCEDPETRELAIVF